jgi:hypothetical protein
VAGISETGKVLGSPEPDTLDPVIGPRLASFVSDSGEVLFEKRLRV